MHAFLPDDPSDGPQHGPPTDSPGGPPTDGPDPAPSESSRSRTTRQPPPGASDGDDHAATVQLLERWHGGDQAALQELIERNLDWIQLHVRQRLGDLLRAKAETQDYVQDAMLEVLRYGPRFVTANRAQFRGLLARIIENVLRDRHDHFAAKRRAAQREQPLPSDSVLHLDGSHPSVTRPSQHAMRSERETWIRLALELLEPDDRKVILLRQHDELSFAEVGAIMGLSENTARMRFQRALPRLAAKIEELQRPRRSE